LEAKSKLEFVSALKKPGSILNMAALKHSKEKIAYGDAVFLKTLDPVKVL
jgi:hypothetical protein